MWAIAWVQLLTAAPSCSVTSLTSVGFGSYDVFSAAPLDSLGTLMVRCDADAVNVTISINAGAQGSFLPRYMTGPNGQLLPFNLFLDVARAIVWGDGSGGSSRYGPVNISANTDTVVYVYARIPARQNVPAGNYSETLTLMVNF